MDFQTSCVRSTVVKITQYESNSVLPEGTATPSFRTFAGRAYFASSTRPVSVSQVRPLDRTKERLVNYLCLLTNLSSSDIAAWAQASVSAVAIVVGAYSVWWQVKRGRMELLEREAFALDGLARLLVHLRDYAVEARLEKSKLERWPPGHPAEPHNRYAQLARSVTQYPLEALGTDIAFEAILSAQRVALEVYPLVSPEPEVNVNPNFQATFEAYMGILDQQIEHLRGEAQRLLKGQRTRFTVEPANVTGK